MIDRRTTSKAGTESTDRGVSEVVAFVLVFGIILGSVGLLYVTGIGGMADYQETEQQVNAERAMVSLTDNFNDVIRDNGVNQRYGELALREGQITTGDDGTEIRVSVDGDPIAENESFEQYHGDDEYLDLGEFTYRHEGRTIAYEGGGLVRGDESGDWSSVLRQPQLTCNDDHGTAVVSLVQVDADDRAVQSGGGLGVTMSVENRSSMVYSNAEEVSITVDEDTEYDDAWESILGSDDEAGWSWDDDTDTGTCGDDDLERVVVTIVEVDVEY